MGENQLYTTFWQVVSICESMSVNQLKYIGGIIGGLGVQAGKLGVPFLDPFQLVRFKNINFHKFFMRAFYSQSRHSLFSLNFISLSNVF
jgi:hypothetical protein